MNTCPVCGAIGKATELSTPVVEGFAEGVLLGIVLERMASYTNRHVSSFLCAAHVHRFRELADKIPETVIPARHRHLLNMGLASVNS